MQGESNLAHELRQLLILNVVKIKSVPRAAQRCLLQYFAEFPGAQTAAKERDPALGAE